MRSSCHCPGEWQEEASLGWVGIITVLVKGGRMRNAEALVCRAAGPRREAPWGAGGWRPERRAFESLQSASSYGVSRLASTLFPSDIRRLPKPLQPKTPRGEVHLS
jgi:hypothetical protein